MNASKLPPIHPGEILRDLYLEPLQMTAGALARKLNVPRTRIERIVSEKIGITSDTALRLARYFDTTPEFWMNLQTGYDPSPAPEGFLAGLVRRVTELVGGGPQVLEETPLTRALSDAIEALALTGHPVAFVQASTKGRPVSYRRDSRTLVINAKHPAVVAHAARPNGMLFLVLAALSEINRELVEVTDAEEVSKVLDLLRANQS